MVMHKLAHRLNSEGGTPKQADYHWNRRSLTKLIN